MEINVVYLIEGKHKGENDWWPYIGGVFLSEKHARPALRNLESREPITTDYRIIQYANSDNT